jgi:putative ABC transport system permease protein
MSPFRLAFHHLWRRKISTLIALIGISVAIATAGILLRVMLLSQSRFSTLARTGDAIVGAKSSDLSLLLGALNLEGEYPDFLPSVLYQSLAAHESVHFEDGVDAQGNAIETIIPFVIFAKVQNFRVIGTDKIFLDARYPTLPKLSEGRWPDNDSEVMLGSEAARKLGASLNENLVAQTWVDKAEVVTTPLNLKVVGILKPTEKAWDRGIYASLATAAPIFGLHQNVMRTPWHEKVLQYFLIYLRPNQMENLKSLVNQRTVAQTVVVNDEIQRLEELTGTQKTLALFITSIIVFLGALSVCTMMITRFESMGQQLAILRAIGYSKRELTSLLFWEAAMIGLCSVLLGAILDAIFFPWVREMLGTNLPSVDITPMALWNSWPVWITAFIGSLVSLLIPMLRLYRQNIHQSLRNIS